MSQHEEAMSLAVKAAAEALDTYAAGYLIQRGHIDLDDIRVAVAAAAPILLAAERAEVDLWRGVAGQTGLTVAALERERDEAAAAERARIAAAIRAAGHPDGYHRVDTTREWAGIYCADCAVTERSARIAETAPEETQ